MAVCRIQSNWRRFYRNLGESVRGLLANKSVPIGIIVKVCRAWQPIGNQSGSVLPGFRGLCFPAGGLSELFNDAANRCLQIRIYPRLGNLIMSPRRSNCLVAPLLAFCLLNTGCASLALFPSDDSDAPNEATLHESPEAAMFRAVQTARQTNSIVLQVEGAEKPMRVIPLPTDGKTVFMNDLLRQTGLKSKYNGLDIVLLRSGAGEMDGVKMAVTFDGKGRVSTGTDYALRPGDRIMVRKVLNSTIQNVLDGLIPPVARG